MRMMKRMMKVRPPDTCSRSATLIRAATRECQKCVHLMVHALLLKPCGYPTQICKPYRGEYTLSSHGLLLHERRSVTLQKLRRMTRRTRAPPSTGSLQLPSRLQQTMMTMMTRMRTMRTMMRRRAVSQIGCNDYADILHNNRPWPKIATPLLLLRIGAAALDAEKHILKCSWLQGHEGICFDMNW